jgi:hypothetical protein
MLLEWMMQVPAAQAALLVSISKVPSRPTV